jgi:hypothetical protein
LSRTKPSPRQASGANVLEPHTSPRRRPTLREPVAGASPPARGPTNTIEQPSGQEWDAVIARTFLERDGLGDSAVSMFAFTVDAEYLQHVDRTLEEVRQASVADGTFEPMHRDERSAWRGAAVETIMTNYLACQWPTHSGSVTNGLNPSGTVISQVVALGLAQRFDQIHRDQFLAIKCPVAEKVARELDVFLRELVQEHVEDDDVALLLGDALPDLRSAIVEAALVAWLVWRDAEPGDIYRVFPGEAT